MSGLASFPLENRDKYKGQIRFIPIVTIPPKINNKLAVSGNEASNSADVRAGGDESLSQNRLSTIGKTQEVYRRDEQVVLYMPPSLQIFDGVNIQNLDLNTFGAGIEAGVKSGSGALEAVASSSMNQISSFMDALSGNLDTQGAQVFASRAAAMFGSDTVSGAVSSALRVTPNPNSRMIFRSVNIREFSFDFRMVPTSEAESQAIKRIVHLFRKNLYPKTIELEGTGLPIAYRFPNTFQVEMYYGNEKLSDRNPDLKLGKMYLRQFSANYNPNGMGFYKNGDFNEVTISLSFTETRALTYDDVATEGENGRDDLINEQGARAFSSRGFR